MSQTFHGTYLYQKLFGFYWNPNLTGCAGNPNLGQTHYGACLAPANSSFSPLYWLPSPSVSQPMPVILSASPFLSPLPALSFFCALYYPQLAIFMEYVSALPEGVYIWIWFIIPFLHLKVVLKVQFCRFSNKIFYLHITLKWFSSACETWALRESFATPTLKILLEVIF